MASCHSKSWVGNKRVRRGKQHPLIKVGRWEALNLSSTVDFRVGGIYILIFGHRWEWRSGGAELDGASLKT